MFWTEVHSGLSSAFYFQPHPRQILMDLVTPLQPPHAHPQTHTHPHTWTLLCGLLLCQYVELGRKKKTGRNWSIWEECRSALIRDWRSKMKKDKHDKGSAPPPPSHTQVNTQIHMLFKEKWCKYTVCQVGGEKFEGGRTLVLCVYVFAVCVGGWLWQVLHQKPSYCSWKLCSGLLAWQPLSQTGMIKRVHVCVCPFV